MSPSSLSKLVFLVVQMALWALVVRAWLRLRGEPLRRRTVRQWLAFASLICGSVTLALTAAMTMYGWFWQRLQYDGLERQYLLYTPGLSLLGIALAVAGKCSPRVIGLLTSAFTLAAAILDAMAI
jgi:hypothetical protein